MRLVSVEKLANEIENLLEAAEGIKMLLGKSLYVFECTLGLQMIF